MLKIFKALGDKNRLRIVKILQQKKQVCVCELGEILGIGQPTTSRHLKILEDAGLIQCTKNGKWVDYSISDNSDDERINTFLSIIAESMNEDTQIINDAEAARTANRIQICRTQQMESSGG